MGEGQEGREYILEQWLFIHKYINASIFTACISIEYLPCFHHHCLSYRSLFTLIHQSPLRPSSLTCCNFFYTFHFKHGKKSLSREVFASLPNPFLFLCWFEGLTGIFLFEFFHFTHKERKANLKKQYKKNIFLAILIRFLRCRNSCLFFFFLRK